MDFASGTNSLEIVAVFFLLGVEVREDSQVLPQVLIGIQLVHFWTSLKRFVWYCQNNEDLPAGEELYSCNVHNIYLRLNVEGRLRFLAEKNRREKETTRDRERQGDGLFHRAMRKGAVLAKSCWGATSFDCVTRSLRWSRDSLVLIGLCIWGSFFFYMGHILISKRRAFVVCNSL